MRLEPTSLGLAGGCWGVQQKVQRKEEVELERGSVTAGGEDGSPWGDVGAERKEEAEDVEGEVRGLVVVVGYEPGGMRV